MQQQTFELRTQKCPFNGQKTLQWSEDVKLTSLSQNSTLISFQQDSNFVSTKHENDQKREIADPLMPQSPLIQTVHKQVQLSQLPQMRCVTMSNCQAVK